MADETAPAAALWRMTAMRQLMALTFLAFTSFFVTLSALPSWAVIGGTGVGLAGSVTTAMLVSTVAVQMLVPVAVQRFGTTAVLVFGLLSLGGPAPLYLVSQDFWWLVFVSVLRGAGFAVLTVLGATLTAQIAPPGRRGEAIGLYGLGIAVPNLVGVPAGVALTLSGSFTWVAVAATSPLLAVPLAGALGRIGDTGDARRTKQRPSRREVVGIAVPSVMLLAVTLAGGGLVTFLPIERPDGQLAVVALAVFGVSGALSRWGAGLVADQAGTRILLPLCLAAAGVGAAGVGAGLAMGSSSADIVDIVVVVAALVFGAGYGSTQNLTLLEAFSRTEQHGLASAVWNVCFDSGTGVGAFAIGLIAAGGLGIPGAYLVSALVIAATLPLVRLLR